MTVLSTVPMLRTLHFARGTSQLALHLAAHQRGEKNERLRWPSLLHHSHKLGTVFNLRGAAALRTLSDVPT